MGQLSEASRKRARYQEMATEGLTDFKELRTRLLSALEETRKSAERELRALQHRAERVGREKDGLLGS